LSSPALPGITPSRCTSRASDRHDDAKTKNPKQKFNGAADRDTAIATGLA